MNQYNTLVKILDEIRLGSDPNSYLYRPELGKVTLVQARSRALIHFFLRSSFGLLNFNEVELLITDGIFDGGIDAYYLDKVTKKIYLIQSKFRDNAQNYTNTDIKNEELWKIDSERITSGEKKDLDGNKYNKKIYDFQRKLKSISNISQYHFEIVVIANLNEIQKKYIIKTFCPKKFTTEIFDYKRVNKELLFPYVGGNFFNEKELNLIINLPNQSSTSEVPIKYKVKTKNGICGVQMFFTPTEEIAKAMNKYKNSILKYNPRSYLGMQTNGVNKNIEDSILKINTNDFVLLNNGITILCTEVTFSNTTGKKNSGKISIINPQIINGGQTSFALSHIYQRLISGEIKSNPFKGKEVLLKIIEQKDNKKYEDITSAISLATNNQSVIESADLKSNDKSQTSLQQYIFDNYGLYYERKKGEFFNAIKSHYILKDNLISRVDFVRTAYASSFPDTIKITKNPKNITVKNLFSDSIFKILANKSDYKKFILSYFIYKELQKSKKLAKSSPTDKWYFKKYGYALRYGDIAVTMIVTNSLYSNTWNQNTIKSEVKNVLSEWKKYENKTFKKPSNNKYFKDEKNPIGYYKGDTIIQDLIDYFI